MLALAFAVTQAIVIVLSFRHGFVRFTGLETFYFGVSMVFLLFWIVARHSPDLLATLHMTERGVSIALLTANTFIEVM